MHPHERDGRGEQSFPVWYLRCTVRAKRAKNKSLSLSASAAMVLKPAAGANTTPRGSSFDGLVVDIRADEYDSSS